MSPRFSQVMLTPTESVFGRLPAERLIRYSMTMANELVKIKSATRLLRKNTQVGGKLGSPTVKHCHQPKIDFS